MFLDVLIREIKTSPCIFLKDLLPKTIKRRDAD
jgi:hypothetical protein